MHVVNGCANNIQHTDNKQCQNSDRADSSQILHGLPLLL